MIDCLPEFLPCFRSKLSRECSRGCACVVFVLINVSSADDTFCYLTRLRIYMEFRTISEVLGCLRNHLDPL